MAYKPMAKEFSWLDVGEAMTNVMSKIPGKIQEARLLDRQIREERIEAVDIYNDFNKMSIAGASDEGIRASIAKRLGKEPQEVTVPEAQKYLMSNFREPREGESTAKYANAMTGAWRKMFYEQASDDNLDQNLIALSYGRMGENDRRAAFELTDGMKNRKRDQALNKLEADTTEMSAADFAKNYTNAGGDISKSKRHQTLAKNESVYMTARVVADNPDIYKAYQSSGNVAGTTEALMARGLSAEQVQTALGQFDAANDYFMKRRQEGRLDRKLNLDEKEFAHKVSNDERNFGLAVEKHNYEKLKDSKTEFKDSVKTMLPSAVGDVQKLVIRYQEDLGKLDSDKEKAAYKHLSTTIAGLQNLISNAQKNGDDTIDPGNYLAVASGLSPEGDVVDLKRKVAVGTYSQAQAKKLIENGLDGAFKSMEPWGDGYKVVGTKDDKVYTIDKNFILMPFREATQQEVQAVGDRFQSGLQAATGTGKPIDLTRQDKSNDPNALLSRWGQQEE